MYIRFLLMFLLIIINSEFSNADMMKKCIDNTDPKEDFSGVNLDELDYSASIKNCTLALKKNPNNPKILRSLGRSYFKKKDCNNEF